METNKAIKILEYRYDGVSKTSALARAVSLHIDGRAREALRELDAAVAQGDDSPELHAARGHLQFELEQYDDAVRSYSSVLTTESRHPATLYNLGVCLEKLDRWQEAAESFQRSALALAREADENSIGQFGVTLVTPDVLS